MQKHNEVVQQKIIPEYRYLSYVTAKNKINDQALS